MKNYFLELPMWSLQYPAEIYTLAERAQVDPKDIADRDGVQLLEKTGVVHWRWDFIAEVIHVHEDQEYPGKSLIEFEDGTMMPVNMHHRKLSRKIQKFMITNGEIQQTHNEPDQNNQCASEQDEEIE